MIKFNKKIEYLDKDIKIKYRFFNKSKNDIGYVIIRFNNLINFWDMEYKVEADFQKMGYGTKIVSATLEDIFVKSSDKFKPNSISIQIAENNLPSIKLAKKLGFEITKSPYGHSGKITKQNFLKTRRKLCEGLGQQQNLKL